MSYSSIDSSFIDDNIPERSGNKFIQAAKLPHKPGPGFEIVLYILGLVVAVVFITLAQVPLLFLLPAEDLQSGNIDLANLGLPESIALFVMLLPFAAGFIGILCVVKFFMKRKVTSVLTSRRTFDWSRFWYGFLIWIALGIVMEFIGYLIYPDNYTWTFDLARFVPVLIVCVILIPLQTSCEEVIFRGYLLQGLGRAFRNPFIAMLLTSFMFGMLHYANPEVAHFGSWILFYYIGVGFLFGLITLLDEGAEIAMGLHASNNLFASLLVTFPSSAFQTPALFTIKELDAVLMVILWLCVSFVLFIILMKKYGWTNYKEKLFKI